MSSANDSIDFLQFLDVLYTSVSDKTKRILAQIGSIGDRTVDGVNVEWWQHVGFRSRPSKPVAGKEAARAIAIRRGAIDAIIASEDDRGLELGGNLLEGETCMYAPGEDGNGQARVLLKQNGSISLYTRVGNKETGKGMIFQLDAVNDAIRMTNGAGYGLIIDKDGMRAFTGGTGAAMKLGSNGDCSMIGTGKCVVDGASICLGSTATPATAVCVGPAGIAAIASTKIFGSVA